MTDRSHLSPSVTTDRNGKVTTVYRKAAPARGARMLPSTPPPLRADRADEAVKRRNADTGREPRDLERAKDLERLMIKANNGRELGRDKTVFLVRATNAQTEALIDAMENKGGFLRLFNGLIGGKASFSPGQCATIATVYTPETFAYFEPGPYIKTPTQLGYALYREANVIYHGLRRNRDRLGIDMDDINDLTAASPEARRRAQGYTALFSAVRSLDGDAEPSRDLVALAFGDSTPEAVAEAVRTSGTLDAVTVRGRLAGAPLPVADGYL